MNFFEISTGKIMTEKMVEMRGLSLTNFAVLNRIGIYPIVYEYENYSEDLYNSDLSPNVVVDEISGQATQKFVYTEKSLPELQESLKKIQNEKNGFDDVFAEIDLRRIRPASSIAENTSSGLTPAPEDVYVITELNVVAEENRELLKTLKTLSIPDDIQIPDAQNIVTQARSIKPWAPWMMSEK